MKNIYRSATPPLPRLMRRHDGTITDTREAALKQWSEHYRQLGSDHTARSDRFDNVHYAHVNNVINNAESKKNIYINIHDHDAHNRPIMMSDITTAMTKTPNHKAAGPDGLRSDIIVNGWNGIHQSLHLLFQYAWQSTTVPDEWLDAHITPLHKDSDNQLCGNYRPIALMPVIMKLYERVMLIVLIVTRPPKYRMSRADSEITAVR
jgi:hypothetical protein